MKFIQTLILMIVLASCQTTKSSTIKTVNTDARPSGPEKRGTLQNTLLSDNEGYRVALDFINTYIESAAQMEMIEFVNNSTLVTNKFKQELENFIQLAWKENPGIGLTADPLIDAQDFPPQGFELHEFDSQSGYLIVKGVDWEEFKVAMRVVHEEGSWLVDGCGIVNIPTNRQIER